MRDTAIPRVTGHVTSAHAILDPQPIISPEQAAKDKAWTEEAIELGYLRKTPTRKRPNSGTPPETIERAARLRREGLPDTEIAKQLGISDKTILRHLGTRAEFERGTL